MTALDAIFATVAEARIAAQAEVSHTHERKDDR